MSSPQVKLSASRLKTAKTCSWLYWAKYHMKLPDKTNEGAARGTLCHLVFECLGNPRHLGKFKKIIKQSDIFTIPGIERLVRKHALPLGVDDDDNIEMIKEMVLAGLKHDFFGSKT